MFFYQPKFDIFVLGPFCQLTPGFTRDLFRFIALLGHHFQIAEMRLIIFHIKKIGPEKIDLQHL